MLAGSGETLRLCGVLWPWDEPLGTIGRPAAPTAKLSRRNTPAGGRPAESGAQETLPAPYSRFPDLCSTAKTAASTRDVRFSLERMWRTCSLTVSWLMSSARAIALFDSPCAR